MTQFSHFFTAVRSLGQERDLRYRGAQKFRGPTGSTSTEPVNKDFEDNIALEETNKQISTIFSCSEVAKQGKYVGCVTPLSFLQASQKKTYLIIKINFQITTLLTSACSNTIFLNHLENFSSLANRNIFHSWRASAQNSNSF